jgi:hypothetical protein
MLADASQAQEDWDTEPPPCGGDWDMEECEKNPGKSVTNKEENGDGEDEMEGEESTDKEENGISEEEEAEIEESTDARGSEEDCTREDADDSLAAETPLTSLYVPDSSDDSDDVTIIEKPKFSPPSSKKARTGSARRRNIYIDSDEAVRRFRFQSLCDQLKPVSYFTEMYFADLNNF